MDESPNYEYLNAVIRGRGTKLLRAETFRTLLRGTLDELELFLLESVYGVRYREQLAMMTPSALQRVENSLAAGSADILLETASLAQGEARYFFTLILSMGDLHNGRLLLRASPWTVRSKILPVWHRYSLLVPSFYDDLWSKCRTPADAAVRCHEENHAFAGILGEAMRALYETGDLSSAERMFYAGWISWWPKEFMVKRGENARRMLEFIGRLTDTWNFSIWLRPEAELLPARMYLPHGWGLSPDALARRADLDVLFSGSGWSFPPDNWRKRPRRELFRLFQTTFLNWQKKLYRKNLLGVDVSIGYAANVLWEWRTLSMIAVGLSVKLSSEELERHLFLSYDTAEEETV